MGPKLQGPTKMTVMKGNFYGGFVQSLRSKKTLFVTLKAKNTLFLCSENPFPPNVSITGVSVRVGGYGFFYKGKFP